MGKASRGRTIVTNLLDKPQPGTCNACCAPWSCCVHHNCYSFPMESEVGSAPSHCTSTVKEADSSSSSGRSDASNSKSLDGKRHSSKHGDNDVSCISEVKSTFNVAVRKKRGRRAPPSFRRLLGKKGDEVIGNDNVVDNSKHDTEEGQAGKSQSILDSPKTGNSGNSSDDTSSPLSRKAEEQDQLTNSKEFLEKSCLKTAETVVESSNFNEKSFWAEKGSGERSQQDPFHLKQDGVDGEPTGQIVLANEACEKSNPLETASTVRAAAMKKTTAEDKTSEAIMDDVSDAQMNTTPSEDKSSEEIEDVEVCDICGDVGEEEKLAVCSRCSDGAEHIYCMRVMMEKVPEGEWFCEECQTEVEFEKERLEKSEGKVGTLKEQSLEGKSNKPVNAAKSRSSSENEAEAENVCHKELNKANQCTDMVYRRREEDVGITSVVRQHLRKPGGSSMGPDSRKRVTLSRESSFRLDVEKGKQQSPQVSTLSASNYGKNQAPPLRGQLPKSTSFNNSKVPKVKQLVNEIPQKPKFLKDPLSGIMKKEGPMGFSTKSATFKKPKSCEPANNERSSVLPPAEEPRVMNSQLSRNVNNDRATSILGCPSITESMVLPVPSRGESTVQQLSTGNNMADSNKSGAAHEQGSRNSLGINEHMISLLAKASIASPSADRSSGILGSGAQRIVIQNSDASNRDDKIKNTPSLRPGASSSSRTIRCQRCNEVGHSVQLCAIDKIHLSAVKPLSERNLMDISAKRNKTSETTQKATSRSADQSEHILKCGPYNPIYRPKDMLPTSFNHLQEPSQLYVGTDEQDPRNNLSTPISTAFTRRPVDSSCSMSSDLMDKSNKGFSPGDETIVSTVPELDYIWQGDFELWRTGKSPELCDGFQAHLSCSASTKVLEVAKKFPSKVQLEELPRQNSWPTQFQENGPTYDNVGVFFFPRDAQSYENHYSKLVQNMLNNDLALRGNIETDELLIFPSNILSKNFQRWNMFYFLWGVFRVKRNDHLNLPPDVPISNCQPNLNKVALAMDLGTSVLSSVSSFSEDDTNGAELDGNSVKPATCADRRSLNSSEPNHQGCSNREKSLLQPVGEIDLEDHHHDPITSIFSTSNNSAINDLSTAPTGEHQKLASSDSQNITWESCSGFANEPILDVNTAPATCSISSTHQEGLKNIGLMDVDHVNSAEVNSGAMDPLLHVSGGSHKRNVDMANWDDGVNGILEHKKIKLDNVGPVNSTVSENVRDGKLSSKVHPLAASSLDDCTNHEGMAVTSNSNGNCTFPLDLNVVDDTVAENIVNVLSKDDEDLPTGRQQIS